MTRDVRLYLYDILESIEKILQYTANLTLEDFIANNMVADAVIPWTGDIKPIKGCTGEWRTRVGDWRIIYAVDRDQLVIMILKVSPRGDAYKNK